MEGDFPIHKAVVKGNVVRSENLERERLMPTSQRCLKERGSFRQSLTGFRLGRRPPRSRLFFLMRCERDIFSRYVFVQPIPLMFAANSWASHSVQQDKEHVL